MTTHSFHPDTHTHGLQDGCPRCAEHAQDPQSSLDVENLTRLNLRIAEGLPARSQNEALAMSRLKGVR